MIIFTQKILMAISFSLNDGEFGAGGSYCFTNITWLVVFRHPSEKWSSSVGMMKFPTEWKNQVHVPNYQPVTLIIMFI
jgi:hypothetical protein